MIKGVGIDIGLIANFKKVYKNQRFLKRIFTKREISYCKSKTEPYISLAGKFSAKEAIVKAFNNPLLIKDIEIINLKSGKLEVRIKGKRNNKVKCSISHKKDYTTALAVIEK